jgi:Trypsin-like peptidase domain
MINENPPRLGGEADPNSWHFKRPEEEGPLPNPVGHTFPLLTHDSCDRWRLVGTGFYISSDGLFITARHVISEVLCDRQQISPLVILHPRSDTGLFGPSHVLYRPIMQCWLSDDDRVDIALGVAANATNAETGEVLRHWCWPLSWATPEPGARVATYAFPRHHISKDGRAFCFQPELYPGAVREAGPHRDSVIMPFPYLEVDCRIHGGASGGPIIVDGRNVVGINCTELAENIDDPPGPGFGTQIRCLKDAFIDDAMLPGESIARRVVFDELIRAGCVGVEDYVASDCDEPFSGFLVRLDEIPATAPHPEISFIQYA